MKGLSIAITLVMSICSMTFSNVNAQNSNEKCAQVNYLQHLEHQYPGYLGVVERTFEEAKARGEASRLAGRATVYTIPVVVHVVHVTSNSAQNLTDEIIEDQIRILNEDFRRLNPDAGDIRSEFQDIVGDAMIEFELQEIKRVGIPMFIIPGLDLYDKMKHSSSGGSDAVDPEHNLNIWVGELFPGLVLGYAYPPADMANWPPGSAAPTLSDEGVVIDYRAFASNNPASSFYENNGVTIEGRTTVHEVGHYLGLRHIWGDGDCAEDDGLEDTPSMADNSQATGCVASSNTCDAGMQGDLPDMWENYMDYSQETCQVAFTNDQIDVMRGVLEGPRSELIDTGSVTCTPPVTGSITGATDVIESATEMYTAPTSPNTFNWTVTGGILLTGAGTNSIQVLWNNGPTGQVCLSEADESCIGNEVCIDITFSAACSTPSTGSITGASDATVSTTEIYSIPSTVNSIDWSVTGGTITAGDGTNSITISWGAGSSGQVCVTESDGTCMGNTVCEDVTLNMVSGITEIAYEKGLAIYPNPASSFIRVSSAEMPEKIEVINVLGAVIKSIESPGLMNEIQLVNFNENILLIKVSYSDGFALERIIVY